MLKKALGTLILAGILFSWFLLSGFVNLTATPFAIGPVVQVQVNATDADGDTLHYKWKATDGAVQDVDAPSTTWALPAGPGLHFLYVQVSDGKGGHIERRIAVNTDSIGTPLPATPPVDIAPPAAAASGETFWHVIYNYNLWDRRYYPPDAQVVLRDTVSGASYHATTDLKGYFLTPKLTPGTYSLTYSGLFGANNLGTDINMLTIPQPAGTTYDGSDPYSTVDISIPGQTFSPTQFFVGHVSLADGGSCGTRSKFFGDESTGTASLLDSAGTPLTGPVRINAYGDYWLSAMLSPDASGMAKATLHIACEGAPVVNEPITVAMYPAGQTPPVISRNISIANHAPTIGGMTATLNGLPVGVFLPPPSGLPSDKVAAPDAFLSFKGLDSRQGACQYYRAIGVIEGCDVNGSPTGKALRFDDWKRIHQMVPYNTTNTEYSATYINKVDLNLTRNHHGTVIGPDHVAAYVCNHLGPTDALGRPVEDQAAVDAAIDNAVIGKNLVACVAFDYSVVPGLNNNQPFTKYLTFGPSGDLLLSVNLDGRAEKFMPGVCVACHGADNYHVRYPEDGTGDANIGAHFLPYDLANFAFSSKAGLTELDQQAALKALNQMILATQPTQATIDLINGWYASGTDVPNKEYVPLTWQAQGAPAIDFYKRVIGPACRTCHVAMDPQFNFDDYSIFSSAGWMWEPICDGGNWEHRAHSMPNSLVTYNRFWNTLGTMNDLPATFVNFYYSGVIGGVADACSKGLVPNSVFLPTRHRDFAGSSRSALLWQNSGRFNAWFMKPDGATRSSGGLIANFTSLSVAPAGSGDFDGDGKADILWRDGDIYTLRLMDGLTPRVEQQIADFTGKGWTFYGIGDFDGDSKADILWQNGDIYNIWLMDGATRRDSKNIANFKGNGWTFAAIGDFNSDTMSDILWRNGDRYSIWIMNGLSKVTQKQIANFTGKGWFLAGVGEFDGSGTDILWRKGDVYNVWLMYGLTRLDSKNIANFTATGWQFAGTGDLNGDGNTDIIWRKGDIYSRWLMNGVTRLDSKNIANFTGTGWQLVP